MGKPGDRARFEAMQKRRANCEECLFFVLREIRDKPEKEQRRGKLVSVEPTCHREPATRIIENPSYHWCGEWERKST